MLASGVAAWATPRDPARRQAANTATRPIVLRLELTVAAFIEALLKVTAVQLEV
jgi:hypothetical protein